MSRKDGQHAQAYFDRRYNSWTVAFYYSHQAAPASYRPGYSNEDEAKRAADRFNEGLS